MNGDDDEPRDYNPPGSQRAHSIFDAQYSTIDDDDEDTGIEGPSGEPFEMPEVEDDD